MQAGTLIFFSGKMGAGKSTKAKHISKQRNAVLIQEDEWLSMLYPNQITTFADYLHYSSILKPVVKLLVLEILKTGTSVVMDFPANTARHRKWFAELISETNAQHELIYLKTGDDICLEQIAKRRTEQPERAGFDTESMFMEVSRYFEEPTHIEGFNLYIEERNE
ncbi:MAG: ATP-binding protein [Gammaproteobacteria bacterium]|nr:ATP-binding protein [Gammaproteobacteria bacterium]MDH5651896.1 ATP-binding protein [Gammaproteobacteria bacterium]